MKQYLVFALVFVTVLVLISGHPVEDQKVTLEDAEAQPGIDDGTGIRAARHFGGGFRRGGFCWRRWWWWHEEEEEVVTDEVVMVAIQAEATAEVASEEVVHPPRRQLQPVPVGDVNNYNFLN